MIFHIMKSSPLFYGKTIAFHSSTRCFQKFYLTSNDMTYPPITKSE